MVHNRLGHSAKARRCFNLAQNLIDSIKPGPTSDARILVSNWIEANVLSREAKSLLESSRTAGRTEKAIRLAEEALAKLGPDDADTLDSMDDLASEYLDAGRIDDALRLKKELLRLTKAKLGADHPDTLVQTRELADLCANAGRIDDAVPLWEDALRPEQEALRLAKAKPGPDHQGTIDAMDNLALAYGRIGEDLLQRGKPVAAAAEFVRAIDQSHDDSRSRCSRQTVCRQLAHSDEVFDRVAKLRPDTTALWIGSGQDRALRGQWAAAAADYAKVIDRRGIGDETSAYAGLLLLQGDLQAYKRFCKKLRRPSGKPYGQREWFNLARALALGPTDPADAPAMMDCATRAAKAYGGASVPHVLGLARLRAGRYGAAIENLQKSEAHGWAGKPEDSLNLAVAAMVHQRLGDAAVARAYCKRARDLAKRTAKQPAHLHRRTNGSARPWSQPLAPPISAPPSSKHRSATPAPPRRLPNAVRKAK